jgi:hypothetical protein
LHYWDWTTDPRATGPGGLVNLFTPRFMGNANGDAGPPFQNFETTEGDANDASIPSRCDDNSGVRPLFANPYIVPAERLADIGESAADITCS